VCRLEVSWEGREAGGPLELSCPGLNSDFSTPSLSFLICKMDPLITSPEMVVKLNESEQVRKSARGLTECILNKYNCLLLLLILIIILCAEFASIYQASQA
jgi:hypothetical protein